MAVTTPFSPEVRERAVRMVVEGLDEYPSQWAAVVSIAARLGMTPEVLFSWVRQAERELARPAVVFEQHRQLKALQREIQELRRKNESLMRASGEFAMTV
ncbi:MAG TPA: transposase [Acidimicrobiia bacterium]|jgi:transposase|nr:transposase [Acidimicrobiia bacterium]